MRVLSESNAEVVLQRRPFGSWLLGRADQSPRLLRFRVQLLLTVFSIGTNLIGALVVFILALFVLPGPPSSHELIVARSVAIPALVLVAVVVGSVWSTRLGLRVTSWVLEDRPATRREQIATLQLPLRLTTIEVVLWLLATVILSALALAVQPASLLRVLVTTVDGGIVTCAASYLLTEFALRPIAARALADEAPPRRLLAAGLKARTVFFWAVGSGVPVAGLMLAAVLSLIDGDVTATRLSVIILSLGTVVLVFGGIMTAL